MSNRLIEDEVDGINVNLTKFDRSISDLEDYREAIAEKMKKVTKLIKKQAGTLATMQKENNTIKMENNQLRMLKNQTPDALAELNAVKLELAGAKTDLTKQKHVADQQINQLKTSLQISEAKKRKMTQDLLEDLEGGSKCCICHDSDLLSLYNSNPLVELCCSSGACKKIIMCTNCFAITAAEERKCVICSIAGTRMITPEKLRLNSEVIDLVGTSGNHLGSISAAIFPSSPAYSPASPAYSPTSPAYSPTSPPYSRTPAYQRPD
jgi:hypothetical protein